MTSNTTAFTWTPALMLTSARIRLTAWPLQLETFTPRFLNKPWSHLDNNRYPLSDSRIIIRRRGEGRGRGEKSLQDLHVALQASGDAQTGLRWRGGEAVCSVLCFTPIFSSVRLKGAVHNHARALSAGLPQTPYTLFLHPRIRLSCVTGGWGQELDLGLAPNLDRTG